MAKYNEGDVVTAKITKIEKYGVFAKIDDEYSGLIHISELADKYIKDISEYVNIGDEINVKILDMSRKSNQLKLSSKNVNNDLFKKRKSGIKETVFGFYLLKSSLPKWIDKKLKEIDKNS